MKTRKTASTAFTGIWVRALDLSDGKWKNVDIANLDDGSFLEWLRSRGGNNPWAESVAMHLIDLIRREEKRHGKSTATDSETGGD